jgi:hypothetical protein
MPAKANTRIAQLGESLHPGITSDPSWQALAQQLHTADREGLRAADLHRIATDRPLPTDHPAAALAYRLIDALGDRTPTTSDKWARPTGDKPAPSEPAVRRPSQSIDRRPYEPPPLPTPPPDYPRIYGPPPRPGPRR